MLDSALIKLGGWEQISVATNVPLSRLVLPMRILRSFWVALLLSSLAAFGAGGSAGNPRQTGLLPARDGAQAFRRLPLSFEPNRGQTDQRVRFLSRGPGYTLFLTPTGAVLALEKSDGSCRPSDSDCQLQADGSGRSARGGKSETHARDVLRISLVGANPKADVSGADEQIGKSNYFIGQDPQKWITDLPNYAKVKYTSVLPGVDLVYYGSNGRLEYDLGIAPGVGSRFCESTGTAAWWCGSTAAKFGSQNP